MTLPASGAISLTDVMTELRIVTPGRAYPISLGDADVRTLAGVPSGAISLTNLYGKSSAIPLSAIGTGAGGSFDSSASGGVADCFPFVVASGGSTPYTYLWSFTSNPDGCTLGNSTSATCFVSKVYDAFSNGAASAVLQCQVTDNLGAIVTVTGVGASLVWDTGA